MYGIENIWSYYCFNDFIMFSPFKDIIDDVYASLQEASNIEDDGDLNKYLVIDLDHLLDRSIVIR